MQINKIVVPLDFSDFSKKALEFAVEVANNFNSEITLLHAVVLFQDDVGEEERLLAYEEWVKRHEQQIHSEMENNRKHADKKGISVKTEIVRGISPQDAILEFLQDNQFDLVIMGTHGRTGLKHLFQGSVAEKVVRLSPIPVLTVHRSTTEYQIKKILVPLDFSTYSQKAADYAIFLAKNFDAHIDFLHAIEQEMHPSYYASGVDSIFEIDPDLKERVKKNMQEFVADQVADSISAAYIVQEGKAHKEIVEFSKKNQSDIIVIATHGVSGLDYILLGSTTEKVVRWAHCPVLTVKR